MKKKIIIFDLDGTLLNTLTDLADSTNFALGYFDYPTKTVEQVRNFVGNGVYKLIERAIPSGKNNRNFEKCVEIFKNNYKENMYNKTMPYVGIVEMLKNLKNKGLKIAVVSNKFDVAVKELCQKYFDGLIDYSVGENEKEGIRKKPSPDMILKVLQKFNLSKDESVFVGDSEVDIQTAKNCNIDCISVLWGFKDEAFLKSNGATILIHNADEIFDFIK